MSMSNATAEQVGINYKELGILIVIYHRKKQQTWLLRQFKKKLPIIIVSMMKL